MVHAAKALAVNMSSSEKANDWRAKNNLVSRYLIAPLCIFSNQRDFQQNNKKQKPLDFKPALRENVYQAFLGITVVLGKSREEIELAIAFLKIFGIMAMFDF